MRELIRVNTVVEANDLRMFLASRGIQCEIPDQYSLSIGGISNFALARGRILVNDEDLQEATQALKEWQSPSIPRESRGISRTLEHPWVIGVSPRQIVKGFRNWGNISFMNRVKVVGGIIVYVFFISLAAVYVFSKFQG